MMNCTDTTGVVVKYLWTHSKIYLETIMEIMKNLRAVGQETNSHIHHLPDISTRSAGISEKLQISAYTRSSKDKVLTK
jgi:hypothetical protein